MGVPCHITFIVANNQRYGEMKRFGGILGVPFNAERPGTDLPALDFVKRRG